MKTSTSIVRRALKGLARGLGYYIVYSLIPLLILHYLPIPVNGLKEVFITRIASIEVVFVVVMISVFIEVLDKPVARGVGETALYVFYMWLYLGVSETFRYEYVLNQVKYVVDISGIIDLVILYFIGHAAIKMLSMAVEGVKNVLAK